MDLAAIEADGDYAAQAIAHQRVVIDDEHPFHHCAGAQIVVHLLSPLSVIQNDRGRGKPPLIISAPHDDHAITFLIWAT